MKKLKLITVLFFLTFFSQSVFCEKNQTQVFKDTLLGISFKYPVSFKKSTDKGISFASKDNLATFSVVIAEIDTKKTPAQLMDAYFDQIGLGNEWNEKKSTVTQEHLNSWQAEKGYYGFGTRLSKDPVYYYTAIVIKGKKGYYLIGQTPKSKDKK